MTITRASWPFAAAFAAALGIVVTGQQPADHHYYENLTPDKVDAVIDKLN
jgi:hypothetical protein